MEAVTQSNGVNGTNGVAHPTSVSHAGPTGRLVTIDGETKNVSAWCRQFGVSTPLFYHRVRRGMDVTAALRTPVGKQGRPPTVAPASPLPLSKMTPEALLALRGEIDAHLQAAAERAEKEAARIRALVSAAVPTSK